MYHFSSNDTRTAEGAQLDYLITKPTDLLKTDQFEN